ncbi:TRAP transporter small permease [Pseudorhodoplanes sp.]|uniref:TRAP transporter small permease n=1 Tax=Pseudorhodoplanes sp. TaxID=1934341 RepID=UPI00391BF553
MLSRIERGLLAVQAGLAALFLVVIVFCVFGQFVSRSLLNIGLHWTAELARFSFVWCALMGAAAAAQTGALHRVDVLLRRLGNDGRRALEAAVLLIVLATLAYLLFYGIRITMRVSGQTSSTMGISMAWVYAAMPVSSACMIAGVVLNLLRLRSGAENDPGESRPQ